MHHPIAPPEPLRSAFGPLVELLRRELPAVRSQRAHRPPVTAAEFARWYLAAVQALERTAAAAERRAPMSRAEVELMCRVTLSAATLGEAIALVGSCSRALHPRAGRIRLARRRDMALFSLDPQRRTTTSASSLVDITGLFAFLQLFQWLIGTPLRLAEVQIGPMRREDVQPFLRLFGAPVLAGGRHYALVFALEDLARPVVRTRGEFAAFFEVFPCDVFYRAVTTPVEQVAALLAAATERGARVPVLREVAAALGIPASTLRRHLQRHGNTFRALRDRALAERARDRLGREELSVAEIAEQLGYADGASFRRAFRRWTGATPTAWRSARG